MARFVWRLQRVLDIREKQERAMRGELVVLTEKAVSIRQGIMAIRVGLRMMMDELSGKAPKERIAEQQIFMKHAEFSENEIRNLKAELENVEVLRKEKMNEILEKRKFIKGLEKLRARAKERFIEKANLLEQKELDEFTNIKFGSKAVLTA